MKIGKFSVKSDIIQVRYKVYTGLCNRGQGFSDFHGVDLWYLVRKPNINRSRYIEINHGSEKFVISKESERNMTQFGSRIPSETILG